MSDHIFVCNIHRDPSPLCECGSGKRVTRACDAPMTRTTLDHPLGTCDRQLCIDCRTQWKRSLDLCPEHASLADSPG